eukprot:TRINITY_DN1242_c0_g1_i1.p1 TRINITY_DN1242_c0_g1~~TRINITY_DN1242_c0_g1_i1.p1  ORF type:complete len:292 (+),score=79.03 TRINITY_DN1242_c0_g1_i1:64-939(+)
MACHDPTCCFTVSQGEIGIVERCGAFKSTAQPGLQFKLPCCETLAGTINLRIQNVNSRIESKTADNVFVEISVVISYVTDPIDAKDAYYVLQNPTQHIVVCVQTIIRTTVPTMKLDEVFDNKDKLANSARAELANELRGSGFKVVQVLVSDIEPAANVKHAMNEINTQERLRQASVAKAEGDKVAVVKNAEAEAESKYLSGVGLAKQRKAIIDGLGTSILEFSSSVHGTTPHSVMQLVMMNQYFDTVKEIAHTSTGTSLFISHNPSAINGLADEIQEVLSGDPYKRKPHME